MLGSTRPHSTESKFRLLYLGADVELISALRKTLTEADYRLITCSDFAGAKLFLESDIRYDLLLMDLEWRGEEVLKLAKLTHSLRHRKKTPIILVAATELTGQLESLAKTAGVTVCVTKTPNIDAVSDAIRQLLER